MTTCNVKRLPLGYYVDRLKENDPFSFVRYGDGEFLVIHREIEPWRVKCSGKMQFVKYSDALRRTLDTPRPCLRGLQGQVQREFPHLLNEWAHLEWVHSDVFHYANIRGELAPFIEVLQGKKVCMIGPQYLKGLGFLGVKHHVLVPDIYAFLARGEIWHRLCEIEQLHQPDVYLFSAGGLTKILIWQLTAFWKQQRFLIDCGSMWEPYVGLQIRRYHRDITEETLKKNRGELKDFPASSGTTREGEEQ